MVAGLLAPRWVWKAWKHMPCHIDFPLIESNDFVAGWPPLQYMIPGRMYPSRPMVWHGSPGRCPLTPWYGPPPCITKIRKLRTVHASTFNIKKSQQADHYGFNRVHMASQDSGFCSVHYRAPGKLIKVEVVQRVATTTWRFRRFLYKAFGFWSDILTSLAPSVAPATLKLHFSNTPSWLAFLTLATRHINVLKSRPARIDLKGTDNKFQALCFSTSRCSVDVVLIIPICRRDDT